MIISRLLLQCALKNWPLLTHMQSISATWSNRSFRLWGHPLIIWIVWQNIATLTTLSKTFVQNLICWIYLFDMQLRRCTLRERVIVLMTLLAILVAYNLNFGVAVVKAGFARHGVSLEILRNPMFDTLDLSRRKYAAHGLASVMLIK